MISEDQPTIFISEWAIGLVKKKLYNMLRSELSQDWPHYLRISINALNNRHIQSLGGIKPADVNSSLDDVKIRRAQKNHQIFPYKEPNYAQQNLSQKSYASDETKTFKVGSYVYIDRKPSKFDKSYDLQVINACSLNKMIL